MNEKEIANSIFELSEENIYEMIKNLDNNMTDKALVYCYINAFYINVLNMFIVKKRLKLNFDKIYLEYKECVKSYYITNNPNMPNAILDDILNFFDNSYSLISTVELIDINDSYEFRHYTINVLELLRMILEKKSKSIIRENIFENYTKLIIETTDKIYDFLKF